MQIGMLGLGRMGSNMVRRLLDDGHECVVYDLNAAAVTALQSVGGVGTDSLEDFVAALSKPRTVWLMVPAARVDKVLEDLLARLDAGDTVIDGGNSCYRDDIRRAEALQKRGIHYVDVGTSGGVHGLERGYCLMIGGEAATVDRLDPLFASLAPAADSAAPTPGRDKTTTADHGYLHCGAHGAGHFVKMVHNGIEYGLMAAFAEGFNILKHANAGRGQRDADAETAPLDAPEFYQYDLDLPEIAEVWRRGSVISSWLLDLICHALQADSELSAFTGAVSDSGEGRWTAHAAIDTGVPTPVLTAALYERFSSRDAGDYANRMLSALRAEFGGHAEKRATRQE